MKFARWAVYQLRRLLGMAHLDMRFDAVEHRLKRLEAHAEQAAERAAQRLPLVPAVNADVDFAAALHRMEARLMKAVLSANKAGAVPFGPVPVSVAGNPEFGRAIDQVVQQIIETNQNLDLQLREAMRLRDVHYGDIMTLLDSLAHRLPAKGASIHTDHPVAHHIENHTIPSGTAQYNIRSPRFVAACERHFDGRGPLTYMDLGCSGAGLVLDFALRGHEAYGVVCSSDPLLAYGAEFRLLSRNVLTADITKPFTVTGENGASPVACDVITAWEVMERIGAEDLPQFFANVLAHLKPDSVFIGSIAPGLNSPGAASRSRTVQPREWWERTFLAHGLRMIDSHAVPFHDFCHGASNGPKGANDRNDSSLGFHFVAVRAVELVQQ